MNTFAAYCIVIGIAIALLAKFLANIMPRADGWEGLSYKEQIVILYCVGAVGLLGCASFWVGTIWQVIKLLTKG